MELTHIRMSADLLDDRVIEMARVTQEVSGDVICVFETLEDIGGDRELRAFAELSSLAFACCVDVLHPAVMVGSLGLGDVLLEDDNVGIRDFLRVQGGDDGSYSIVDGLCVERWCR